jgi:hypothetical protein
MMPSLFILLRGHLLLLIQIGVPLWFSMPHSSDVNLSNYVQFTVDPKKLNIKLKQIDFNFNIKHKAIR